MLLTRSLSTTVVLSLILIGANCSVIHLQDGCFELLVESFDLFLRRALLSGQSSISLWAEDGTTLLPEMAPLTGKSNIAKWLDAVTAKMPGYRVARQENDFHDAIISGEWASEWGTTTQVVQPPEGKAPIEIHGKILLVLHREKDGEWKIKQEMWNSSPHS